MFKVFKGLASRALSKVHVRLTTLILVSVLPAAALILSNGAERARAVEESARESARSLARQLASRQRDAIWNARELLLGLSYSPEIRTLGSPTDCAAWLARVARLNRLYADVFVADTDGKIVCRTRPFVGTVDVSDRPYFKRAVAQRGFAIGELQTSRITGDQVLVFSHPVFDEQSAVAAVVSLAVTPSALLAPFLVDLDPQPHIFAALLDANGALLASVPESPVFKGRRIADFARLGEEWSEKTKVVRQTIWADGVARISAIAPVTSNSSVLYASVGLSSESVMRAVEQETRRSLVLLFATTALLLFTSWVIAHRFVLRRVHHLSKTAQRLGSGDLSARTQLSPADGELGRLAHTLDGMADAFQRSMESATDKQNSLRRANRALRFLSAVNRLAGHTDDEIRFASLVCRAAITSGGYRMACIRFAGPALTRTVRSTYRAESEDSCFDETDVKCPLNICPLADPGGGTQTAAQHVSREIAQDADVCVGCQAALACGGTTAVSMRLACSDVAGALSLVAHEDDAFDAEELAFLDEAAGQVAFGVSTLRAQHWHRKTQEDLELRDRAIDANRNGILIFRYAEPNQIVSVNPTVMRLIGAAGRTLRAGEFRQLARQRCSDVDFASLFALIDSQREGRVTVSFNRSNQADLRLDVALTLVDNSARAAKYGVLEIRDVTQQLRYENELAHQANHDGLTGMPNRNLLIDRLEQAMGSVRRGGKSCFVLWVDIDRFQVVHHSFGRSIADEVVVAVSRQLRSAVPEGTTVARVADDEFVLIAEGLPSHEAVVSLATGLLHGIRQPLHVGDQEVSLAASVGVARFVAGESSGAEVLLQCAKIALFHAKQAGGDAIRFYEPEMTVRAEKRMRIETALRHAIDNRELSLEFQPTVDLLTGDISGCEALCRWKQPELGQIGPTEFIAVAEESGLISSIGQWVLEASCCQLRAWLDDEVDVRMIAVNVSALQFATGNLVDDIARLLLTYRLPPGLLMIEITESSLMKDADRSNETLRGLKNLGVKLAIDDFGTGYSSLASLRQFPIDYLKIDRSFVLDLATSADAASIAVSIISLAHNLNLRVIAEGVETEGQMAYLRGRGCDEMQGWHFSKAVPADELASMVRQQQRLEFPLQTDLPERTLLLVDDEPSVQSALRRSLRRQGYTVLFAASVAEALEVLAATTVGVIISDFRMPGLDGVHLLQKSAVLYPGTVRIALSGYADIGTITDAINCGAIFRLIHKPWNDRQLLEAVRQAFDKFELDRAYRGAVAAGVSDRHIPATSESAYTGQPPAPEDVSRSRPEICGKMTH